MAREDRKAARAARDERNKLDNNGGAGDTSTEISGGSPAEAGAATATDDNKTAEGIKRVKNGHTKPSTEVEGLSSVAQPNQRKKRTTRGAKTVDPDTIKMVAGLFGAGSVMLAGRAGSHWMLSENESMQLATPVVGLLDKYKLLEKVTNNSEIIGLVLATTAIIVPRVMVSVELSKQKRRERKPNVVQPIKPATEPVAPPVNKQVEQSAAEPKREKSKTNGGRDRAKTSTTDEPSTHIKHDEFGASIV